MNRTKWIIDCPYCNGTGLDKKNPACPLECELCQGRGWTSSAEFDQLVVALRAFGFIGEK